MEGIVITNKGIENITQLEIKELTGLESTAVNHAALFSTNNITDFFKLAYKAQSIRKILLLLSYFESKENTHKNTISFLKEKIEELPLSFLTGWLGDSFIVRCNKVPGVDLSRQEVESSVGAFLHEKTNVKVDLSRPQVQVSVFLTKTHCFLGINLGSDDLGKRSYRIFRGAETLKANVGYSLLRIAGLKKEEQSTQKNQTSQEDKNILVDPFCGSGTIPIEAALFLSNIPVNFFDKERLLFTSHPLCKKQGLDTFFKEEDKKIITSISFSLFATDNTFHLLEGAKKNAKIANVKDLISFSRTQTDWLELKFEENTVEHIVTHLPVIAKSKRQSPKQLYKEFFYQAKHILKPKANITLLSKVPDMLLPFLEEFNFKIKHKRIIHQGNEQLTLFHIEKE